MLLEKGRGGFREGYFCLPKCGFYDPSLSWMLSETPLLKANCLSRCSVLSNFGEKHLYIKPKGKPHQSHQQLDIPPSSYPGSSQLPAPRDQTGDQSHLLSTISKRKTLKHNFLVPALHISPALTPSSSDTWLSALLHRTTARLLSASNDGELTTSVQPRARSTSM